MADRSPMAVPDLLRQPRIELGLPAVSPSLRPVPVVLGIGAGIGAFLYSPYGAECLLEAVQSKVGAAADGGSANTPGKTGCPDASSDSEGNKLRQQTGE